MHIHSLYLVFILFACLTLICETSAAQDDLEQLEEVAVRTAVESVSRSVVQIETISGSAPAVGESLPPGPSTGIVVDSLANESLIVTATYNLRHNPASIFIRLPAADGGPAKRLIAEEIARDENLKLTLLRIKESGLVPIRFYEPNKAKVGQTAIAVGKVYSATDANVSVGIVSAKDRIWSKAIQTDAKVSRSNYGGPLINLEGEAMGVLVPMSPDVSDVSAGAEWYDSGIGFAALFDPVSTSYEKLKNGQTIRKGLIGVSFQGSDVFNDPALVVFSPPTAPAAQAGILPGDKIVSLDGMAISNQAQLKHALGPHYEDDVVSIGVERGADGEKLEFELELAGEIEPFVEPSLGILFDRTANATEGLLVERVIPESPADRCGVSNGDRLTGLNEVELTSVDGLRAELNRLAIDASVVLELIRGEESKQVECLLAAESSQVLQNAEPRYGEAASVKEIEIKVAESANFCLALVPEMDNGLAPVCRSVFVWVPEPGPFNRKAFVERWKPLARKWNTIIVIPQSANSQSWNPGEAEFIAKAILRLKKQTPFDAQRVAIGGSGVGGIMAAFTAFQNRELFRGLVMADTEIPSRLPNLETSPAQRLHLFVANSGDFRKADQTASSIEAFRKIGFPVHFDDGGPTANAYLAWIQMLDRQ